MTRFGRIHFDWQIGLIGLSAFVGLLIAYNRQVAALQFAIVCIAIMAYLILANIPDPLMIRNRPRSILPAILVVLPVVVTVIFLLTNDWSRWIGKVPALDSMLRGLAALLPGAAGAGLNPNIVGGSLAALLPLQVFALRPAPRWISVPLIALTLVALILCQTRGAWLALIAVAGMWALWKALAQLTSDQRHARRLWMALVAVCGAVVMGILLLTPFGDQLLGLTGDRRAIWHNSVDLIGDYPITGFGLAGFEMVYSTYVLLLHVGHTMHAHNLWLDVWLNQGIIGAAALAGMVLNAVWPKPSSVWRTPALLALGVVLLYGLIDDPYYGAALLVVFVPLGLLIRPDLAAPSGLGLRRSWFQPAYAVWISVVVILAIGLLTPMGRAVFEANLGTLAQTRVELDGYSWPNIPIQDALRRPGKADLSSAVAHYLAALALDPANAAANRRLGQIALAREQFDTACSHLAAAYQAMPQQRATRQLLGECNAISGHAAEAASLWKTIDVDQSQLDIRRWWYNEYLQDHGRAAQLQTAMNVLAGEP